MKINKNSMPYYIIVVTVLFLLYIYIDPIQKWNDYQRDKIAKLEHEETQRIEKLKEKEIQNFENIIKNSDYKSFSKLSKLENGENSTEKDAELFLNLIQKNYLENDVHTAISFLYPDSKEQTIDASDEMIIATVVLNKDKIEYILPLSEKYEQIQKEIDKPSEIENTEDIEDTESTAKTEDVECSRFFERGSDEYESCVVKSRDQLNRYLECRERFEQEFCRKIYEE